MSSDQKASSENGRKRFFDSRREEMEKVKPLLDLGLWKCAYGDEDFKDLLDNLAEEIERKKENPTYDLAERFTDYIEKGDSIDDDGSDCYAFYMALIEELGIEPQAVKDVKDNYFDITLPMSDGPFTVCVRPFDPYVPEPWQSEIAKKANAKKADDQEDDGKRVDPRWHYFVSWAKYKDVILNSNSKYAVELRYRDDKYDEAKNPGIGVISNKVLKKWCGRS